MGCFLGCFVLFRVGVWRGRSRSFLDMRYWGGRARWLGFFIRGKLSFFWGSVVFVRRVLLFVLFWKVGFFFFYMRIYIIVIIINFNFVRVFIKVDSFFELFWFFGRDLFIV